MAANRRIDWRCFGHSMAGNCASLKNRFLASIGGGSLLSTFANTGVLALYLVWRDARSCRDKCA